MNAAASRRRMAPGTVVVVLQVVVTAVALAVVAFGNWRLGVGMLGGTMICASFARSLLPERAAGLLRVRRAPADVVVMTTLGVILVMLSVLVPEQPPGL